MRTREEVEEFLNKVSDDALDNIKQTPRSLAKWIDDFTKALRKIASDEDSGDEDDGGDEDDEDFGEGIFADPEDF